MLAIIKNLSSLYIYILHIRCGSEPFVDIIAYKNSVGEKGGDKGMESRKTAGRMFISNLSPGITRIAIRNLKLHERRGRSPFSFFFFPPFSRIIIIIIINRENSKDYLKKKRNLLLLSEPDIGAQHVGQDNLVESEPGASERDQE